jgi:hypothetical protein
MARKRQQNIIRTDTIEREIGLAWAKKDYAAVDVWRAVANKVSAPIDELEIKKVKAQCEAVLATWNS